MDVEESQRVRMNLAISASVYNMCKTVGKQTERSPPENESLQITALVKTKDCNTKQREKSVKYLMFVKLCVSILQTLSL